MISETKEHRVPESLLEEGARSYLEALVAIEAFRRVVRQRCRSVLRDQLSQLSEAVGPVTLDMDAVKDWETEAGKKTSDGSQVGLGVKIWNPILEQMQVCFYFGLWWSQWDEASTSSWFGIYTGAWVKQRRARMLVQQLQHAYPDERVEQFEGDVSMCRPLGPEGMKSFDQILTELVGKWIKLGKESGSYQKLLMGE
jgi:hypothetical protein